MLRVVKNKVMYVFYSLCVLLLESFIDTNAIYFVHANHGIIF